MTNRENIFRVFRRNKPERIPFGFDLCPSLIEKFKDKTGQESYMEYFNFPYRYVELEPTKLKTDFSIYFKNLPPNAQPFSGKSEWGSEWGLMSVMGSVAHFEHMIPPLANYNNFKQLLDYPFPDLTAGYRWVNMKTQVDDLKKRDLISIAFMEMTIFEISWYLRGMEQFLEDMILNKEFCNTLLDIVLDIRCEMAKKYAQADVDILMVGDDVATQEAMMISKSMWKEYLKYRLKKVIDSAKEIKSDILVLYHSDGNCRDIILDLIEVGIDILNPVQPECMDPIEIKNIYGDRLSFWGTLGTQTTMPFGTETEVIETCIKMIKKVGKGGGLLLAPTHTLEPEVPWENIMAYLHAVKKYGKY